MAGVSAALQSGRVAEQKSQCVSRLHTEVLGMLHSCTICLCMWTSSLDALHL